MDDMSSTYSVYPNPASAFAYVKFDGLQAKKIDVIDMTGKRLVSMEVSSSITRIPTDQLNQGTYIIAVDFGSSTDFKKLTIIK
jgi:hypothetical protein